MKFNLKKEWPYLLLVLLPFAYLAWSWNGLPEKVPTHFNARGEADAWGPKNSLIGLICMTTVLVYAILLIVPHIDPKDKIKNMGAKFNQLKFIMVAFMAAIGLYIVYAAQADGPAGSTLIFVLVGLLLAALGNYFQALKPNYFIGIRTPWTLEHPEVWKSTHKLGGWLWFVGGLLMVVLALALPGDLFQYVLFAILGVLIFVPLVHSYLHFKKLKK
ncbi:SdpI family protein [Sediminicola luteus]|uniref:DUF1648 domain-containing protein n=1 Tax=Sediminicola luteus TaxID=319238 RepID=A0A2A4G2W2_9FLAO|nr:SdpI family protein [Sediminicola luteus]PCE62753.1 hypothetical protein B7P33_15805 [Sediminicola luteus]